MTLHALHPTDLAIWDHPALESPFCIAQHIGEDMLFFDFWVIVPAVLIDPPHHLFDMDESVTTVLVTLDGNITAKILCGEFLWPIYSW